MNSLPVPVREGFLEEAGAQWGMTVVEVSLGQSLSLSLSLLELRVWPGPADLGYQLRHCRSGDSRALRFRG